MNTPNKQTRSSLWLYVPLWLFLVYLMIQIFNFHVDAMQNIVISGMYFILFGVHEASHLVFAFLPSIFVAAAGSMGEIAFTSLIVLAAYKARSYFAAIFGALWLMLAMNSAGNYMADARAQLMPLIGPSDQPIHDWHFVFSQLGWLQYDTLIGGVVRGIGDLIGIVALGWGLWLLIKMTTVAKPETATLNR